MKEKTHYEILGVSRNASAEEIRRAFRDLAQKTHPDRTGDSGTTGDFIKIREAYEALKDQDRRRKYDEILRMRERPTAPRPQPKPQSPPQPKVQPKPPDQRNKVADPDEIRRLMQLMAQRRVGEAETLANQLVRSGARQAVPYAVLGDIAQSRGDYRYASEMYGYAVQMDPTNMVYQQRFEEMIVGHGKQAVRQDTRRQSRSSLSVLGGFGVAMVCASYVALAKDPPFLPRLSLISTWSIGLFIMLLLGGIAIGAGLAIAGQLDDFSSVHVSAIAKVPPAAILMIVALVNFWAAAILYFVIGLSQSALHRTTTILIGSIAAGLLLFTLATSIAGMNFAQTLAWGGNLMYVGGICGWLVSDAFSQ